MSWRVGSKGLRVIHTDGSESLLPAGTVLPELPGRYEGTLVLIGRPGTYDDKMLMAGDYEVKHS